jgi:hypothetical protein
MPAAAGLRRTVGVKIDFKFARYHGPSRAMVDRSVGHADVIIKDDNRFAQVKICS